MSYQRPEWVIEELISGHQHLYIPGNVIDATYPRYQNYLLQYSMLGVSERVGCTLRPL